MLALKRQGAFTLIELVAVIVILSIIAIVGSNYVVSSMRAYHDTQNRSNLINQSRQAIERMTRQIRGALPNSVRLTNADLCLEFLPVAGGGNYTDPIPLAGSGATGENSLNNAPYRVDFGTGIFLSIGALTADELYGAGAGSRASLAAAITGTGNVINLAANTTWLRDSVSQRLYLLDRPQAFCRVGNELRFFDNQDINSGAVDTDGTSQLLAGNVSDNGNLFVISTGVEERNVRIDININFIERAGPETVTFNHQVSLRNVP